MLTRACPSFFGRLSLPSDGHGFASRATMKCARLAPRRMGSASVLDAAGRSRTFGAVLAVGSLFASGCGATTAAANGQADGSSDAVTNVDAPPCSVVLASDYDQSCTVDTDCVAVGQVPACPALACYVDCTMWTISKSAAAQYMTALSRASASVAGESCGCVSYNPYPCCRGGMCTTTCGSPVDTQTEAGLPDAGSSRVPEAAPDATGDAEDAGAEADICVMSNGSWTCPGNTPSPQCPGNASNPINPGDQCSYDGGCFYCNRESAGIGCACNGDADGGRAWQCVGAGYGCMP